ncbi:putative mitochondrial carrier domain superfamily [Helianthus debilis subsp. tardiflorus]
MGEEKPKPIGGVWPTVKPFVNGGASGMLATCVIQPIDMIKVLLACAAVSYNGQFGA